MDAAEVRVGTLEHLLTERKTAQVAEILSVFLVSSIVISIGKNFVGDDPLGFQAVVWLANLAMLGTVWLGLRLRGQSWSHLGLIPGSFRGRKLWSAIWKSVVVFAAALVVYAIGAIAVVGFSGMPAEADLSGYNYLSGNLPMLVIALLGVYIVSSFGEEVLHRGFLITRFAELGGSRKIAWRVAVVVSSIIFGLIHFRWGPMGMVQTGFMGLALGIAYLVLHRNLWILVMSHAYMDTILLVQMYLEPA